MTTEQPKTIVYIDGFNFYYGALRGTKCKWLDIEAFCRLMLPKDHLVKIRYFTARVRPRPNNPRQAVRQQAYLRALQTLPLVEIHYGHFLTRCVRMPLANPNPGESTTVEVLRTEEKGSDVNLASYLILDAFRGHCDTSVIFTNDSDQATAIRIIQSELGVKVGIVNPHPRSRRSRKLHDISCQFYKQVSRQLLEATQLPPILHDSQGQTRKPDSW